MRIAESYPRCYRGDGLTVRNSRSTNRHRVQLDPVFGYDPNIDRRYVRALTTSSASFIVQSRSRQVVWSPRLRAQRRKTHNGGSCQEIFFCCVPSKSPYSQAGAITVKVSATFGAN